MKHLYITHLLSRPLILCLLLGAPLTASAQMADMSGPPKVLRIDREFLKPGKNGASHEKTESEFVRALTAAKSQSHYFALDSITGQSRSLFFFPYASFEAMEKETLTNRKNVTLTAALDRANTADGELLSSYESSVFVLRDDLSLNTGPLLGKRYMEITQIIVKPGHTSDVEEIANLYRDAYKKSAPSTNFAAFQLVYGFNTGDAFLFITTFKSLSEADREILDSKKLTDDLGATGRKHISELTAASVESAQTNLFEINPKISYPPDEWVKAEPDFWKPKAAAPAKKPDAAPTK